MADSSSAPAGDIPSAFSLALRNPLNLVMLGALGVSAALTGSSWPLVVAAVAEAGWLALGPGLASTARQVRWIAKEARERATLLGEQGLLRQASERDRRRFLELDLIRKEMFQLVEGHDNLTLEMMGQELHKVDRLLMAYLRVAASAHTQARVLADTDESALEAERAALPPEAADQREVLGSRLAQVEALKDSVRTARREMDRVEQALRLMRDQLATLRRPEDLTTKLDDLVQTVEVVAASGRETERIGQGILQSRSIGH